MTIYYLPDEYAEICRIMQEEGVDQKTASCAVLGLNVHTLGRMVAEHLHFPRLLVDSMQAPVDEKLPAPQDASQATLQIAGLAARIGDILCQSNDNADLHPSAGAVPVAGARHPLSAGPGTAVLSRQPQ
ncbi:MAG: hypothetical protein OEN20_09590, partial [Gammaproteobacteria bacterium]|nr:hypothetical protein [Gammaproteobacteria bacterium]